MKFKIGDKVKIVRWLDEEIDNPEYYGIVGVVTEIGPGGGFDYRVKIDNSNAPYYEQELQSTVKIGEQLLFNFMLE